MTMMGLTKPSEMRQPLRRIRHGPNQPIRRGLPHRVQQPKGDIKEYTRYISLIPNCHSLRLGRCALSRIVPEATQKSEKHRERRRINALLIIPRPDMHSHNHTQQNRPSQERPHPPPILSLIEQQADQDAPNNLGDPINRIVHGPSLDSKQHSVVIAKLPSVKVVAGEEHWK